MVNVIHKQLRFWKAINSEEGILQIMFPEITVKPKQQNAVLPKGGTIAPHLIHLIVPQYQPFQCQSFNYRTTFVTSAFTSRNLRFGQNS